MKNTPSGNKISWGKSEILQPIKLLLKHNGWDFCLKWTCTEQEFKWHQGGKSCGDRGEKNPTRFLSKSTPLNKWNWSYTKLKTPIMCNGAEPGYISIEFQGVSHSILPAFAESWAHVNFHLECSWSQSYGEPSWHIRGREGFWVRSLLDFNSFSLGAAIKPSACLILET